MLDVRNISRSFGEIRALADISIRLRQGEVTLFVGPNGSGKSTLLKVIAGVIPPDSGTVSFGTGAPFIGYMPQDDAVYPDLTVLQNLRFFSDLNPKAEGGDGFEGMLSRLKLYDKRNALASELSGGLRRALSLACTLAADPDIVVLDEPTTGFDYTLEQYFWELLSEAKEGGKTVLMSSHSPSVLSRVDRVVALKDGRLLGDAPVEEISAETIEEAVIYLSGTEAGV